MNTQERQRLVAHHEAEAARLQGEVSRGDLSKLFDYGYTLANKRAAELGVDLHDLEHVETPPCPEPQAQVNVAYLDFLVARKATLETAIRSACYWLSLGEHKRALECLNQSLTA